MGVDLYEDKGGINAIELSRDGKEADVLWEWRDIRNPMSGAMIQNDRLYTSVYRKKDWMYLDALNGNTLAQWEGKGTGGNIIYADDRFYILSMDGYISLWKESEPVLDSISNFNLGIKIFYRFAPL